MSVIWYVGNTSPPATDTIAVQGVAQNLTGASVRFRARDPRTSALVIDQAATIVTPLAGTVSYTPTGTDTATAYVAPALQGWWHITLSGGAVQDAPEFPVYILDHAQASTSDLCTVADVRQILEVQSTDSSRDQSYAAQITAASMAIMRYTDHEFAPITTSATRRFHVNPGSLDVDFGAYDLRSAAPHSDVTVTLSPEAAAIVLSAANDQFELNPLQSTLGTYKSLTISPMINTYSIHRMYYGRALVDVTGAWGCLTIPPEVKVATARTVGSWVDRGIAGYGGGADQPYLAAPGPESAYGIPLGAQKLLWPYRKVLVA